LHNLKYEGEMDHETELTILLGCAGRKITPDQLADILPFWLAARARVRRIKTIAPAHVVPASAALSVKRVT
jgi:hypothetical protein